MGLWYHVRPLINVVSGPYSASAGRMTVPWLTRRTGRGTLRPRINSFTGVFRMADGGVGEVRVAPDRLHAFTMAICRADGSSEQEARLVADHLVLANLFGHDSHGVGMMPAYIGNTTTGACVRNHHATIVKDNGAVIVIDGESMAVARPNEGEVEPVDSLFAYPMGNLRAGAGGRTKPTTLSEKDAATVRKWLRIALAAEASGLLHAAIASAVEHLTLRKQFGRPLGTFQALRHRMAECTVLAGGVRWLALKAAATADEGDAALAAMHAQNSATRVVYDVHQMLAAMGMTLEHPLHLWTYRLKALLSESGGRGGQAQAVAEYCFETP